eukprot:ANDGO_03228.mRNA.1 putative acetyl-CoA acetyltransferase
MTLNPRDAYIVSYARTPIGLFLGAQSKNFDVVGLGAHAIKAAVTRATAAATVPGFSCASVVDEVLMGMVLQGGCGMAPVRRAALRAGLPDSVPCTAINKVCASGMKALELAALLVRSGSANVVVTGGMESMSRAPHYMPNARSGQKYGTIEVTDSILHDGLTWEDGTHMGKYAELLAEKYAISREEQDTFAIQSYERALKACEVFSSYEVVPLPGGVLDRDAEPLRLDSAKMKALKPAFQTNGTVTAGNASTLADGAAALVVMSGEMCMKFGITPVARCVSFSSAAHDPAWFTTAPSLAIPVALKKAGVDKNEISLWEFNEAYSSVPIVNSRILGIPMDRLNVYGGAVALGHPLGCSGARIVCTLLTALKHHSGKFGCASVCNGGGGASACVVELL